MDHLNLAYRALVVSSLQSGETVTAEIQFSPYGGPAVCAVLFAERDGRRRRLRDVGHETWSREAKAAIIGVLEEASSEGDALRAARHCTMSGRAELEVVFAANGIVLAEKGGTPVGWLDFSQCDPQSGHWAEARVNDSFAKASGRPSVRTAQTWRDVTTFFAGHGIGLALGYPEVPPVSRVRMAPGLA